MPAPALGSVLLASSDTERLRRWYEAGFGVTANPDGFLDFGGVSMLIDARDDVADHTTEPGRLILNFHVDDARATARELDRVGVDWLVPVERRADGWFGTLFDPDGNLIQIIELSPEYWAARRDRATETGDEALVTAPERTS
jgi:predicted enzyme related to lactoylglutathione lyase